VLNSWYPSYEFAKIAKRSRTFRFRGALAEPFSLVVKTKDDIKLVETAQGKTTSLTGTEYKQSDEVLGVLGNQLLLYGTSPADRTLQVRRIPLPSSLFSPYKTEAAAHQP
jgi:hypothetical protein